MKRQHKSVNRPKSIRSQARLTPTRKTPAIKNGHLELVEELLRANASAQGRTETEKLEECWRNEPRWQGLKRSYSAEKVLRLRGTMKIEHTIADKMSRKLWNLLNTETFVPALGALTGNQAVQMAEAGLKAIYLSGWQVAADANLAATMYPDQSLYPAN